MIHVHRDRLLFKPGEPSHPEWMREFAQCPTPLLMDEHSLRIFFATRPHRDADLQYVARTGFADFKIGDSLEVASVSQAPVLDLGASGTFDEFGVMPGCIARAGDELRLYYSGWTRARSVPYTLAIGVAVSNDGGRTFRRIGPGPCHTINMHEPYFVTGPMVQHDQSGWKMWYLSCRRWQTVAGGRLEPVFHVSHATSSDGLIWEATGGQVVPMLTENECQDVFAPFFENGLWHALFAFRDPVNGDGRYRLGYAYSYDQMTWSRDDSRLMIHGESSGWDNEMICYPQMFMHRGQRMMLYCGNAFGQHGFGLARVEVEGS